MSYDVNAKLDAYRESIKKKEEILAQLNQGVVNTQAEIHMLTGAIQALEDIAEEEGLNVENTHAKACGEKSATMLGEFMIKCCLMEKIDAQNKNAMPENISICGDKSIQQN